MTTRAEFQPGITTLLRRHSRWLRGARVALVSHSAAVDRRGTSSLELLLHSVAPRKVVAWAPEHGYFGRAGAGELVNSVRHPLWNVPIHSLYGAHRAPTAKMMQAVDLVVVDLQDIAVRCYTYASTLRHVMEEAARHGRPVIVADRPVPFPSTLDGPMLDPACASFVGAIPAPVVYGMTPAECARWLHRTLALDLDLRIAPMQGYARDPHRRPDWPPWMPPSPGIATWESAWCYPATVLTEAFPELDCGRTGRLPFQTLTAPWGRARVWCEALAAANLPGLAVHPHTAERIQANNHAEPLAGVRFTVTDPLRFRPLLTAVTLLHLLQTLRGPRRFWNAPGTRPEFLDKLFGTATVREQLRAGATPAAIAAAWPRARRAFTRARENALLYRPTP